MTPHHCPKERLKQHMQSGKHTDIKPLGNGKEHEEEFTERSKFPVSEALQQPTNDKAVPRGYMFGSVKRSRAERASQVVGSNSADGAFIWIVVVSTNLHLLPNVATVLS